MTEQDLMHARLSAQLETLAAQRNAAQDHIAVLNGENAMLRLQIQTLNAELAAANKAPAAGAGAEPALDATPAIEP